MYNRMYTILVVVAYLMALAICSSCSDDKGTSPPREDEPVNFILVPGDFPTISEAIDSAQEFDTIVVSDGSYRETISFHDKMITVASEYLIDGDESHIANTIIDGTPSESHAVDSGSVVTFNPDDGHYSVLIGMTVTGGVGTPHTIMTMLQARGRCGGGVFCIDASPRISHCVMSGNVAEHGGGMFATGSSRPSVTDCTFVDNKATDDDLVAPLGGGGALYLDAVVTLHNCEFRGNSSAGFGGAVSVGSPVYSGAPAIYERITIEGCRFVANSAGEGGGAVSRVLTRIRVSDCAFDSNHAEYGGAVISGIAQTCIYRDCRFAANSSTDQGGAICALSPEDSLIGCVFHDNVSGGDGAAGHWFGSDGTVLKSCTFVGNSTLFGGKSALMVDGTMSLEHCIIAFNSSCRAAPTGAAFTMIECTDIYGNQEGDWTGAMLEYFSTRNDNFSADPVFCDKLNRDLRIKENSPCAPENSGCGQLVGAEPVGCQ